jgi:hypothetical protein
MFTAFGRDDMSTRSTDRSLRVPASFQNEVERIFKLTDTFCAERLDAEYGELVRKLVAKLARKRPSPLLRGDLRIWAAAAIYTVGSVNFLFDPTQRPHLTGDDLSTLTGVPKSTLANKAKLIRDLLRIGQLDPEFCRRELLASNPLAWMISVNGFIVDARTMPPEVLAEARRRGLIPDLPAHGIGAGAGKSHEGRAGPGAGGGELKDDDAPAMGLAEAVRDVIDILRGQPGSGSEGADGWDRIVRTLAESDSLPDSEVKVIEKAIAQAYRGWSDAQRRSIWYETDSGMTDDDDDEALCDTSFNGIGYALQVEMLDEVTHAASRDADELKKATAKRPSRKEGRGE